MAWMNINSLSLQIRIFLSMIVMIVVASLLLAAISIVQFQNEARSYHQERLERKENAIKEHINFVLNTTPYKLTPRNLGLIFKDKIHELANIHNLEINIYSLDGQLVQSSKARFWIDKKAPPIPAYVLKLVKSSVEKRYVEIRTIDGKKNRSSFSEIKDNKFKPLGILNLPYVEDDGFYETELQKFLVRLSQVYSFMIMVAFALAYFLSKYVTKSLKTISNKINETSLNQKNEKIVIEASSREIKSLITAYNAMVDKLEESALMLAQSEREQAWREMAKQVAHEIKNPLTPMRLVVQNFQRKFDQNDPSLNQKLDDYTKTLIQQIDTMSAVASAFSNFATMPAQQNETLNVVHVVELALEIFNESFIAFHHDADELIALIDRTQLIRVVTNLVKNALQAIPDEQEDKRVWVSITEQEGQVVLSVADNGVGIPPEHQDFIFEPKFTTKTSGMGLGLGIIKNIIESYHGTLSFQSLPEKGTIFIVRLPVLAK
jgi:signal transduction histidine kinase